MMQYIIKNLSDLNKLALSLLKHKIFFLYGPIGVGKSSFVSFVLKHFSFEPQGSPTFTLINYYANEKIKVIHADAYRDPNILQEILILDYDLLFIEWPSKEMENFFSRRLDLRFTFEEKYRIIRLEQV